MVGNLWTFAVSIKKMLAINQIKPTNDSIVVHAFYKSKRCYRERESDRVRLSTVFVYYLKIPRQTKCCLLNNQVRFQFVNK